MCTPGVDILLVHLGKYETSGMPERRHDNGTILRWASWFGLLGAWFGCISAINRVSPDLYHEMALFREALAVGSVPTRDVFAYTPTVNPCVHHEWGSGAVFYGLSMGLGSPGMMLLKYVGALLVGLGCLALARRRGASDEVFALFAPVAILCGCIGFFSVRAQLFTLVFTLCLLHLLEQDRQGRRGWILVWLPVYVVWLNMHAGFLVGVGLFGIYVVGRWAQEVSRQESMRQAFHTIRHLLAVALSMAVLFNCNPYGWQYAPYLWQAVRLERSFITEWQAVWHFPRVLLVYAISLLPLVYLMRRPFVVKYADLLMILVPAVLAFQHVRHLSIYAVVWACYVPPLVEVTAVGQAMRRLCRDYRTVLVLLWIALGMLGVTQATRNRFWELRIPATHADDTSIHYPVGAVDYLKEQTFSGNVMVPFEVGAFVSWKLHPAVKVSCDGRYEVAYPPQQVEELWDFYASQRDWRQILRRYPPDVVLVPRSSPLENLLEQTVTAESDSQWKLVYRDDGFSLYARRDLTPGLPVVDRSGQKMAARFP
jgi:hypothetical protein